MVTLYLGKDYSVAVEEDGSILVQRGDWLSKYSAAIHGGDKTKTNEYGRMKHGVVQQITDADIEAGETIYHIPTYRDALRKNPKMWAKAEAYRLINDFYIRRGKIAFKIISRYEVAKGLRERVANPGIIDQGRAGLCPSASLVHILAKDRPNEYARLIINLYEQGVGRIGAWEIKPDNDLKNYTIPHRAIHPADWIPMASIRDSENWFFDYQEIDKKWHWSINWLANAFWSGGARFDELEDWVKNAGYTKIVKGKGNQSTRGNLKLASDYRNIGFRVILAIDHRILDTGAPIRPPENRLDHFVVLTSNVSFRMVGRTECVSMTVFTWGKGKRPVPAQGVIDTRDFLEYYYGFVGAKF